MKFISSRDNPAYKSWKKLLHSSRERKKAGQLVLEGLHLLQAWEECFGLQQATILCGDESSKHRPEIGAWLAIHPETSITCMPESLLQELGDTESSPGILAVVSHTPPAHRPNYQQNVVLLDGIQDPGNLGTLLRTTAAAGFQQILLSTDCTDPWSPKTLRAGQGAHFQVEIHENQNLSDFLSQFTGTSIATCPRATLTLYQAEWQAPVAWVFGSEGQGVRRETLAQTTLRVSIPMPGTIESLNVGTAAAVCLFETVRRQLT